MIHQVSILVCHLSERIDGTEVSFERWIKPEAILAKSDGIYCVT